MHRTALLALTLLVPMTARAEDDAAKQLAQKLLDKGAALFDTKDAQAMAATWTADGTYRFTSKDESTGQFKTEVHNGREEIQRAYAKMFENQNATTSRNTVEAAHMIGTDVLVIRGTFEPDTAKDGKLPFVQIRAKQGDQWMLTNLELFLLP